MHQIKLWRSRRSSFWLESSCTVDAHTEMADCDVVLDLCDGNLKHLCSIEVVWLRVDNVQSIDWVYERMADSGHADKASIIK